MEGESCCLIVCGTPLLGKLVWSMTERCGCSRNGRDEVFGGRRRRWSYAPCRCVLWHGCFMWRVETVALTHSHEPVPCHTVSNTVSQSDLLSFSSTGDSIQTLMITFLCVHTGYQSFDPPAVYLESHSLMLSVSLDITYCYNILITSHYFIQRLVKVLLFTHVPAC